jgi:2-aminoadipate transaminase
VCFTYAKRSAQDNSTVTTIPVPPEASDDRPAFQPHWSRLVQDLPRWGSGAPRAPISFAFGLPDAPSFPGEELAAATELVVREHSDRALQYGPAAGQPRLIEVLIEKLNRDEGLALTPENVLITNGSAQALGLIARLLVDPGDVVLIEAPTWPGAINLFERAGARLVSLPFDDEGLDLTAAETRLTALAAQGVRPKFLYTIPTFQNPMGLTLSAMRREALLDLAARYDLLVVEDDAYRDLVYEGEVPPSLLALDGAGRVIRTGTFSKVLAAGLRLGWAVGTPATLSQLTAYKEDGGTSPFSSYVTAAYMLAGALEPHIAELIVLYRQKRDVMLRAMQWYFPAEVRWTRPAGGFFIWVTLPPNLDASDILPRAREQGIDFLPGARCFPTHGVGHNPMRLAFSLPTPDQIEEGIKRLGATLKAMM